MPNTTNATQLLIPNTTLFAISRDRESKKFMQTTTGAPKLMDTCSLEYVHDVVKTMEKYQQKEEILFSANRVAISFVKGYCEIMLIGKNPQTFRMTRTGLSQLLTETKSAWAVGELIRKCERLQSIDHKNAIGAFSMVMSLDFKACPDTDLHFRTCLTRIDGKVERIVYGVTSTKYTPFDALDMLEVLNASGFGKYSLQNITISREGMITSFSEIPITAKELKVQVPCIRFGGGFVKNRSVWIAAYLFKLWCTNGCGTTTVTRDSSWTRASSRQTIQDGIQSTATGKLTEAQKAIEAYDAATDILLGDMFATFMSGIMTDKGVSQRTQDNVFRHMADETVLKNGSLRTAVDVMTRAAQEESQSTQLLLEQVAWEGLFEYGSREKVVEYVGKIKTDK